jgi:hypothetical protein
MKIRYMVVPGKPNRIMFYFQSAGEAKVFIEKDKNYKIFVVSVGLNPKMLKSYAVVNKFKDATILAKNVIGEINKAQ